MTADHVLPLVRVVFVLVASEQPTYAVWLRIAIMALRITNPQLDICVVCDPATDQALRQRQDPLPGQVDEWLVIPGDGMSTDAALISRALKTSLRQLLRGDFLYLDTDILVRAPLTDLFAVAADLAGARNHSCAAAAGQIWSGDQEILDRMGWRTLAGEYVNTGVLLVRDTPAMHAFYAEWHRRWRESCGRTGRCFDQPAFNATRHDLAPDFMLLGDHCNAQFRINPATVPDALIWHYYANSKAYPDTTFDGLVAAVMSGRPLRRKHVMHMLQQRHPWQRQALLGRRAADGLIRRGRFDGWEAAWLQHRVSTFLLRRLFS